MQAGQNTFRVYFVAVLAALWLILALASARGEKWPIAGLCLVMAVAHAFTLYRLTRQKDQ
ncbi:hypothetical protein MF271_06965 [Deinococcus sp. KNUC1210]|uniref:hypothetical protein n=1 Tax=Deinococcus sp. KNUC1210 TaxID=2917691 RepID=UPI001EF1127F|nr:hypothetical protein [Deinococcus sp. KNUC1210]ULH16331.1 hypothetical protein MF271_06965 [Deinococcus sp. KNUC1210]